MWLVDSSRFIDWMRGGRNPVRILQPFVVAGQVITCGLVRIEVLRGVINPPARNELSALFDAISEVSLSPDISKAAADLAWKLDRSGQVLPMSDLIIACCALHAKAHVVTTDPHSALIPSLRVSRDTPRL